MCIRAMVTYIKAGVNIATINPAPGKAINELHNFRGLTIPFSCNSYVLRYLN